MKKLFYVLCFCLCIGQGDDWINMNDVTGWDATENGIMLYLQDGSGYYIEK